MTTETFFLDPTPATNATTALIPNATISRTCFEWCRDQHFGHAHNFTLEMMVIPMLAFFMLGVHYTVQRHYRGDEKEKRALASAAKLLSYVLQGGFLLWFVFFA